MQNYLTNNDYKQKMYAIIGGLRSGGLMSGGLKSGGLMSGGLKSANRVLYMVLHIANATIRITCEC